MIRNEKNVCHNCCMQMVFLHCVCECVLSDDAVGIKTPMFVRCLVVVTKGVCVCVYVFEKVKQLNEKSNEGAERVRKEI